MAPDAAFPATVTVSTPESSAPRVGTFLPLMSDSLRIRDGLAIPMAEIAVRASRSSGPGGQHANVTASRIEASFDIAESSALSDAQKARAMGRLGRRVTAVARRSPASCWFVRLLTARSIGLPTTIMGLPIS